MPRAFASSLTSIWSIRRSTVARLASEPALNHLKSLNITAIELMPVHHHVDDRHLVDKGLTNYWGYNTLAFFAPEPHYTSGALAKYARHVGSAAHGALTS